MNGERMMSTADKAHRKRMFREGMEEQYRVCTSWTRLTLGQPLRERHRPVCTRLTARRIRGWLHIARRTICTGAFDRIPVSSPNSDWPNTTPSRFITRPGNLVVLFE